MASPRERNEEEPAGNRPAGYLEPNGTCSRCNAPLVWVKTTHGRNLPLNPEPSRSALEGNFGLGRDGVAHYVRDSARMRAFDPSGTRSKFPIYIAHFATCTAENR
jgi:hypothetical protein